MYAKSLTHTVALLVPNNAMTRLPLLPESSAVPRVKVARKRQDEKVSAASLTAEVSSSQHSLVYK